MSEVREQSYYEIALTNRQVMSIFIVLLVCLLASFVSGVWIGRQGAGVRVQTADAQRIEGESGAGEAPLGEMDFFSEPEGAPDPAPPADRVPADPPATSTPPPASQPPVKAAPESTQPEPTRPAPPAEPAPRPAEPAADAPSTASAPAAGEFLYIQVFSGIDREQAQGIVERLKNGGYAAFLSSVEVGDRLMHRVRIGPYSQRDEAEGVAGKVQREFKLSTWITR